MEYLDTVDDCEKDRLISLMKTLESDNEQLKHELDNLRYVLSLQKNHETTTDRQTDEATLKNIYESCGLIYYYDDLQGILKDVIKELCRSDMALMYKLRINHIDRAIAKYVQAKEKVCINNTKQYFKACIKSAVQESFLDESIPFKFDLE